MTDNTESLILEHLKRFQVGQDRIERKLEEIITRMGNLEISVASLRRDFGHSEEIAASMSVRVDRLNERIERIERRLELTS
ncbi:hypothetical protein [Acidithiobacillus sp.]